jgi:endonuclease YncB( thermonuclease family)
LVVLALGSALAGTVELADEKASAAAPVPVALVERVVDGDTVIIKVEEQSIKVRLIGVDAPESEVPIFYKRHLIWRSRARESRPAASRRSP